MFGEFLDFLWNVIVSFWWAIIPPFLLFIFLDLWLFHKREEHKRGITWNLLEIKVPKEVLTTPKSMEQVFTAMHAIYSHGFSAGDKWLHGALENWLSFEIIGRAGSIHFYVRSPEGYRDLVESAIYSQYPEAEIHLVPEPEDYVNQFPMVLPNKTYDIWGTDIILAREDAYPLRTYPYFEASKEEQRIDPIALITETMSRLEDREAAWLQLLIRPTDNSWINKARSLISGLMGEKKETFGLFGWVEAVIGELVHYISNFFVAWFEQPDWPDKEEGKKEESRKSITSAEKKAITAIEEKISKTGFESVLRFVYIDKRDSFTRSNIAGVMGALQQFNDANLNALKPNSDTTTKAKAPFSSFKIWRKKRKLHSNYRLREFPEVYSILNTEELATLYHFPISGVKSPSLRRMEVRRAGPPADLPIFG